MPRQRSFAQVDVFGDGSCTGNPVAVVLDAEGMETADMQRFAHWTNLSETTFVLVPADARADYRVRIFTPDRELPFAGHPTLGTCHAWLEAGGVPRDSARIVQECGTGLVPVRRDGDRLSFAAPPLLRSGPVDEADLQGIAAGLGIRREDIVDAEWADNGPGWAAILLDSAEAVLALRPGLVPFDIGIVGPYPAGSDVALELRAVWPQHGSTVEDPATGSLNASVAQWLLRTGRVTAPYTASQGAAIGRAALIRITQDPDGTVWTGGRSATLIRGTVDL
jgi:PhzF family phenazine biosynthesis protein